MATGGSFSMKKLQFCLLITNYAKAIRQEYVHVPEGKYREGRKAVLEMFLNRETIYRTGQFREQFGERAKRNITDEISNLN